MHRVHVSHGSFLAMRTVARQRRIGQITFPWAVNARPQWLMMVTYSTPNWWFVASRDGPLLSECGYSWLFNVNYSPFLSIVMKLWWCLLQFVASICRGCLSWRPGGASQRYTATRCPPSYDFFRNSVCWWWRTIGPSIWCAAWRILIVGLMDWVGLFDEFDGEQIWYIYIYLLSIYLSIYICFK